MRRLIVNADDFGLSNGVNRGIAHAHEHGIVTATSLMVRQPAARAAAAYAGKNPTLSVGLHVDLGEWRFDGEVWCAVYGRVDVDDAAAVEHEVDLQLSLFRDLVGRAPTHLDSHQHVHRREPLRSLLRARSDTLGVPLRHESAVIRYEGAFYGQTGEGEPRREQISVDHLRRIITELPPGATELCCHPALSVDFETMYADERILETATLCDPAIAAAIEDLEIVLCGFTEVQP